jgi:hypothetical protein
MTRPYSRRDVLGVARVTIVRYADHFAMGFELMFDLGGYCCNSASPAGRYGSTLDRNSGVAV